MDSMFNLLQGLRPKAPRSRRHFNKLKSADPATALSHFNKLKSEPEVPPGTLATIPSHLQNYTSDTLHYHDWPVIAKYGKFSVRLVDGEAIRDSSLENQEFTDFGLHSEFPALIPPREIWLAQNVPQNERQILIHTALQQIRYELRGFDRDTAYDKALKYQSHLRGHANAYHHDPADKKVLTVDPVVAELGFTAEPRLRVVLVNGEAIRNDANGRADFVEGTNDKEDAFCPPRTLMIEEDVPLGERFQVLTHEFSERHVMDADGLPYEKAHDIASKVEFECRQRGVSPAPEMLRVSWVDDRIAAINGS